MRNNKHYLLVNFTDAGLFFNDISGMDQKDRIYENGRDIGSRSKFSKRTFGNGLIHVNHVSNLLHVMTNRRPVPSFRKVKWGINEELMECAKNSFVSLDGLKENSFNDPNIMLKGEAIQRTYASWDSWRGYGDNNWFKIRNWMLKEQYDKFITFLGEKFSISPETHSFEETRTALNNVYGSTYSDAIHNKFNKDVGYKFESKGMFRYITLCVNNADGKYEKSVKETINCYKQSNASRVNTRGISTVKFMKIGEKKYVKNSNYFKISGNLCIPVSENVLNEINNGIPICTFLDNGIAYIDSVVEASDFNTKNFIKL